MNKFTFIALVFGLAEAHKLNRFITDDQYAVEQAQVRRNMVEDDEMPEDHLVQLDNRFLTDEQWQAQEAKKRQDQLVGDEMPDDHLVQFITDQQYAVQQEKKRYAKENEMTDFQEDDHMVQTSSNIGVRFITDEQYAVQHQKDMKNRQMGDEDDEDHLVQTSSNIGVRFITDEQYAVQHEKALFAQANYMNDIQDDDHLVQLDRFVTDEQYAVEQAQVRRNMIEDDEMPDDHLVQTQWVELPDCDTAADKSRPLELNVNADSTLTNHKESPANGSSATCKPRVPALAPVVPKVPEPPVAKASALGTTRPF